MRDAALVGRSAGAIWRRWPFALSGLSVMILGPLICWSLVISGELQRLGILPAEHHHWLALAGSLAVWIGWGLVGAQARVKRSRLGGALLGVALYMVAGWVFFFGLAMYVGHAPLDIVMQPYRLLDLRMYASWPIVAAAVLGLISLD